MVILFIIIFIIILYFLTFRRIRKARTKGINAVEDFHENYIVRRKKMQENREIKSQQQITNYITKYNSSVDYREKT